MAKKEEKKTEETAIEKKEHAPLAVIPDYGEDAGQGFEGQTSADASYPFISVLQPGSPIVMEGGAQAGDLMNTATGQIYKRDQGLLFIPATTRRYFAKWVPRGEGGGSGGFRGHFDPTDLEVVEAIKNSTKYGQYRHNENGEVLVLRDTFYVYGSICTEADEFDSFAVMAFWSTKIKSYRSWMQRLGQFALKVPMYAHLTRITTKMEKNDKGVFFVPVIKSADPRGLRESLLQPTDERYEASKALRQIMLKNGANIDYSKQEVAGDTETQTGDTPF